ncbi:MAG: radical SAM protein [Candidatus Omnitrophica bacterium]|nr:radical SAM protein [Candidatus Omnitrophota bacterium]
MLPLRNFKRFFFKALRQPFYALLIFFRRSLAVFSYWLSQGYSGPPESLTLFLTHRCNLRCKMCGQWGEGGVTKKEGADALKDELPIELYRKFLDDLSKVDRPSITLFGGEPLLYTGCLELIRYIKSKKMHCLMITNGSLLADAAGAIVESGLDELNISLDGGAELHDQIRGNHGLFQKIMDGIGRVNDHKEMTKRAKPLINLQCTITKYNYQYLEQLLSVAEQAKADSITFHNLIFLDQNSLDKQKKFDAALGLSSKDWQGFVFEPGIDPQVLRQKISFVLSSPRSFKVDFYPNFSGRELKIYYCDPGYQPPRQNSRCLSPWLVAYLFPDGTIRPCLNFGYAFGNLKKDNFFAIWNNVQARQFRIVLRENKIFPACIRCTELYRY